MNTDTLGKAVAPVSRSSSRASAREVSSRCNDMVTGRGPCHVGTARTEGDPGCGRVVVDPEGHPGEDGDEDGRHVGLQDEVADVPLQPEAQGQPRVGACGDRQGYARGGGGLTEGSRSPWMEAGPHPATCSRLPGGVCGSLGAGSGGSVYSRGHDAGGRLRPGARLRPVPGKLGQVFSLECGLMPNVSFSSQ